MNRSSSSTRSRDRAPASCNPAGIARPLLLLALEDAVAVEIHQVIVACEGVGEALVLLEVLEIVEDLALAARHAGDLVDDQQVGHAFDEIGGDGLEHELL